MNNKVIMAIVVVLLLGIFALMAIEAMEKSPREKMADSISDTVEEIGDNMEEAMEKE